MKAIVPFLLSALLSACATTNVDRAEFHEWTQVTNDRAHAFRILQNGEERLIVVFGPGGDTDTVGLYLIGDRPVGVLQPLPPLERVVVATTTHLPFLGALGLENSVVGAVHLREVFDERFNLLANNGRIRDVGTADGLDQELLITLRPQVIFDDPFGKNIKASGSNSVPVVHITEYLEEHPLGRAEWLKVFGILARKEALADSIYRDIKQRYNSVAAKTAVLERRPVVFFGSAWQGQWFSPPVNSYMVALIQDAGGEYVFNGRREGNITLDLESVLHKVRRSDHFGMILTTAGTITPDVLAGGEKRLERIPAVSRGGFYGNSASSDLFGQALLEPDVVLMDLCRIFHPDMGDTLAPRYFRKIDT